jgi:hypothetical protein
MYPKCPAMAGSDSSDTVSPLRPEKFAVTVTDTSETSMNTNHEGEKPPTIRPGQKRPYVKGTQAQIDQRRGFVARMLDTGATKTQIHRAMRQRFNIQWRQCDRYIKWLARVRAEHPQITLHEWLKNIQDQFVSNKSHQQKADEIPFNK